MTTFGKTVSAQNQAIDMSDTDRIPIAQQQLDSTWLGFMVTQQDFKKSRIVTSTTNYSIASKDDIILMDATAGARTATLPTAIGIKGVRKMIKKIDSSGNAVTVATTSAQTIEGVTTKTLSAQWNFITVISDGANWILA